MVNVTSSQLETNKIITTWFSRREFIWPWTLWCGLLLKLSETGQKVSKSGWKIGELDFVALLDQNRPNRFSWTASDLLRGPVRYDGGSVEDFLGGWWNSQTRQGLLWQWGAVGSLATELTLQCRIPAVQGALVWRLRSWR